MDSRWKSASAADVVEQALVAELDIIAITDHNTVEWCDRVREAASGTGLTVLPGAEISTGQGHLLAIFDPAADVAAIRDVLIRVGFDSADFGNVEAITKDQMDEVAAKVVAAGGLAIAAHVDKEKGFWSLLKKSAQLRRRIHACADIRAFELVDLAERDVFEGGTCAGYPRRVPCIQGSDCWAEAGSSHQLDAIGRRYSLLKLDELSVASIRQALGDSALRVRLTVDEVASPRAVIEGVSVDGGFLDGERFRFSENITCLIGGTGSGKSLTLELIRFALDQQVPPEPLAKIRRDIDELLRFALGDAATVRVVVTKDGNRYVVERAWHGSGGSDSVVSEIVSGALEPLEDPIKLARFFPIKGFSQGEVIEYAREPLARLSLIDDLIELDDQRRIIVKAKSELRKNGKELVESIGLLAEAEEEISGLSGLREQIKNLGAFFKDSRVAAFNGWAKEQAALGAARESIDEAGEIDPEDLLAIDIDWTVPEGSPSPELMEQLRALGGEVETFVKDQRKAYSTAVRRFGVKLAGIEKTWEPLHKKARSDLERKLAKLDRAGKGLQSLYKEMERHQKKVQELERIERELKDKHRPRQRRLLETRDALLDTLQAARREIRIRREAKAAELTARLEDRVRVRITREGYLQNFQDELVELAQGSRIRTNQIEEMARELQPIKLVRSLLDEDFKGPAAACGLDEEIFRKFWETVEVRDRLQELLDLQIVDLEDVVGIQFAVEGTRYRELEKLAHGQKCTVVLMVALAEGDAPLIVDQPEDALHAPWIEENIVPRLRGDRGMRQCLFATRSGSVLVSADAEQVIAMGADADRGRIVKTGSIDRYETRELILYHVEGGPEPFERRRQKYEL